MGIWTILRTFHVYTFFHLGSTFSVISSSIYMGKILKIGRFRRYCYQSKGIFLTCGCSNATYIVFLTSKDPGGFKVVQKLYSRTKILTKNFKKIFKYVF